MWMWLLVTSFVVFVLSHFGECPEGCEVFAWPQFVVIGVFLSSGAAASLATFLTRVPTGLRVAFPLIGSFFPHSAVVALFAALVL